MTHNDSSKMATELTSIISSIEKLIFSNEFQGDSQKFFTLTERSLITRDVRKIFLLSFRLALANLYAPTF